MREEELAKRFWSKVNIAGPDECWEWTAGMSSGYGCFHLNGKMHKAHRISYEMKYGCPLSNNIFLDHTCHNTKCVNPNHLRMCSHRENIRNAALSKKNTTGFKGVSYHKAWGKYVASITVNYKTIYLGGYDNPDEAHAVYARAAIKYFGEFANNGE